MHSVKVCLEEEGWYGRHCMVLESQSDEVTNLLCLRRAREYGFPGFWASGLTTQLLNLKDRKILQLFYVGTYAQLHVSIALYLSG